MNLLRNLWESPAVYRARNWRAYYRKWMYGASRKADKALLGGVLFGNEVTVAGELGIKVFKRDGRVLNYGIVGWRSVTDAGVAFLVDDWDGGGATNDITLMNFHDSGTGSTAENVTDTDLITPAGPTTRATGTKSQPAANQFRSVGTINYSGTLAIVEHGLFNQAARGAGTVLWDRTVFSAVNVVSGESIQFTYTCTVNSGG